MKTGLENIHRWSGNKRTIIAVISCVFGIALMALGFSAGSGSKQEPASAPDQVLAENQSKKKIPVWNMALGNIVVVARELGFGARLADGSAVDEGKVASRIEGQLQHLRELYREESDSSQTLMGAMLLQLKVSPAGEVTDVKELSSRIADDDFKKAVGAAVSKWKLGDLAFETVTIHCPLLFVREGMDITTLVNWEKSLGQTVDESALAKRKAQPSPQRKTPEPHKAPQNRGVATAAPSTKPAATPMAKPALAASLYQIRYTTAIRKEPNFSSPGVARFTSGTKVTVIGERGDWVEVRYVEGGPSGYLRKEFLTPVAVAQN